MSVVFPLQSLHSTGRVERPNASFHLRSSLLSLKWYYLTIVWLSFGFTIESQKSFDLVVDLIHRFIDERQYDSTRHNWVTERISAALNKYLGDEWRHTLSQPEPWGRPDCRSKRPIVWESFHPRPQYCSLFWSPHESDPNSHRWRLSWSVHYLKSTSLRCSLIFETLKQISRRVTLLQAIPNWGMMSIKESNVWKWELSLWSLMSCLNQRPGVVQTLQCSAKPVAPDAQPTCDWPNWAEGYASGHPSLTALSNAPNIGSGQLSPLHWPSASTVSLWAVHSSLTIASVHHPRIWSEGNLEQCVRFSAIRRSS